MNRDSTEQTEITNLLKRHFGVSLEPKQVVVQRVPVSHTADASLFLTPKNQLYGLIRAQSALTLGDVKTLVRKMGLAVTTFLPPHGQETYFADAAHEKFCQVFPGRRQVNDTELRYYLSLVSYNPALFKVDSVTDGVVRQFDTHDSSGWRAAVKFTYKQISL